MMDVRENPDGWKSGGVAGWLKPANASSLRSIKQLRKENYDLRKMISSLLDRVSRLEDGGKSTG